MDARETDEAGLDARSNGSRRYVPPTYEALSLACEISAYALDEDEDIPLI
jgi:hypothetical protein